jgi:hypothetical protein
VKTVTYQNMTFDMVSRHEQAPRYCNIDKYDTSILLMFQCGALSAEPHALWHAHEVDKRCLPRVNGNQVHLTLADWIGIWRTIIADSVPQRPLIVVTGSAEWDSYMAILFLHGQGRHLKLEQKGLEKWGWYHTGRGILADWDWKGHVETYLKAIRTGFGVEKLYWRTHPNCPLHDDVGHKGERAFLNNVHERQAEVARQAVESGEDIWGAVGLIDWRKHFRAKRNSDCDWIHYRRNGYQVYANRLFIEVDWANTTTIAPTPAPTLARIMATTKNMSTSNSFPRFMYLADVVSQRVP